ncbi:crotonase/enoyl-CoA hydratase family protein [Modestobacter sp. I12A-02628]|uniref:Crotonase/enoyl-CoA hydratase family protein n=2 Tax=Goekera deserti TaxID=2497753 RepID=A0A7K3WB97_9ACTN|nr:crotonase/enoyl-CoA hydratase family protein [Goekera deserti]NDI47993.1 crotonase/enoyl-CoA hydratase family protein [Goekera deserti]NEL53741.1 crotonase/enoyl-CoA hydratase family protein [Goekera deserti]
MGPDGAPAVLYDVDGPVATIRLNRPAVRNSVDGPTARLLREAFHRMADDDAVRVAVLAGEGGTFCAGADLTAVGDPARRNDLDPDGGGEGPMGPTRTALSKPLIAAVSGHAVAGGLELALLADLRVAEEDAVLGVFCRRWGVPLIDGGTARLPRVVGLGRALDLVLTGRPVDAAEALSMGLVDRVVPRGGALAAAQQLAAEIAAFPFGCMLADRASVYAGLDLPLAEALRAEGASGTPLVLAEGVDGAARFVAGEGRHGSFGDAGR